MKVNIDNICVDRVVDVHVDEWDSWNADYTLALVILPVLKQLREDMNDSSQGYPLPVENIAIDEIEDKDPFSKWCFIVDEMIWAFGQTIDDELEDSFFIRNTNGEVTYDKDNHRQYLSRIKRGTVWFGEYFSSLWT